MMAHLKRPISDVQLDAMLLDAQKDDHARTVAPGHIDVEEFITFFVEMQQKARGDARKRAVSPPSSPATNSNQAANFGTTTGQPPSTNSTEDPIAALSVEQRAEIEKLFRATDKDNSGYIDSTELGLLLNQIKQGLTTLMKQQMQPVV